MALRLLSRMLASLLFIFSSACAYSSEENFLLVNGTTNEIVLEFGPNINEQVSPCSTFKIVLSLMGYDAGILLDENNPVWPYQEGYDDFLDAWKTPQSPQSWMTYSCVWYSQLLAIDLGSDRIQNYLATFEYGNQDMSGGLTSAWLWSSLKISPKEQVAFIQKITNQDLPISSHAFNMAKAILFKEELPEGWKLFGKTGWSGSINEQKGKNMELGWFVGWIEKDQMIFPFAYNIRDTNKIDLAKRVPRVKQLLVESNVMKGIVQN